MLLNTRKAVLQLAQVVCFAAGDAQIFPNRDI